MRLQTERSRDRFPVRPLDFSVYAILPAALWLWGLQPLTNMNTRNLPGSKRAADSLIGVCEPIV
jgi:hypothetical protein